MKTELSIETPDFSKAAIPLPCPRCRLETPATLGAIKREESIICRGCHSNIRLRDHIGEFHRALETLNQLIRSVS